MCKLKDTSDTIEDADLDNSEVTKIAVIIKQAKSKAKGMTFQEVYNVIKNALKDTNNVRKLINNVFIYVM